MGIPVITVSNDPFGHAIKTTLEHLQRSQSKGTFGLAQLPSISADFLGQIRSGRLFGFTWPDEPHQIEQAKKGILRQLEGARLIEPVGFEEFQYKLTVAGQQTKVELHR